MEWSKTVGFGLSLLSITAFAQQQKPNIVLINADDLGYGDLSCNGMTRTSTPNVDGVARNGIRMTNVHASSATSTPSRFSLLTGMYAWREPGRGVAPGDAAMLITPEMGTMPGMLKRGGYVTAAVGKWHLGLGSESGKQDWNGKITPGLDDVGFDYSYIMAATADRVPCVFIEQGRVVGLDAADPIQVNYRNSFDGEPTGRENPELLRLHPSHGHDQAIVAGISRIGYMKGGKSALWVDDNIADSITAHALRFMEQYSDTSFFLYLATNDIHVPRVPHERFSGKSGMGARGDAILQFDWCVGQVVHKLEQLGIADRTLLIITSDNGPVLDDGYKDKAVQLAGDHKPGAWMRGGKYSIFEAGTRIPFIAQWKGRVPAGVVSDAALSQVDLFATLSQISGVDLEKGEAPDSQKHFDVLTGKDKKGRSWLVEDAYARSITMGGWKYIVPKEGSPVAWETGIETGTNAKAQLYNLKTDKGELVNLVDKYPARVKRMAGKLQRIVEGEVR